jgi:hypothetical protein
MSLWTKAALGAAAVAACAGGAQAQVPAVGCTTCGTSSGAGGVANTIPRCSRHNGLTQYPLSEKRYIKQFCNPTIAPGSCFGYHKTQWTAWGDACPQWCNDPAVAAPSLLAPGQPQPAAPGTPAAGGNGIYQPKAPETAPAPAAATPAPTTDGPPSKPLDLPPAKTPPAKSPLDLPAVPPMPPTAPTPGGSGAPTVPPVGSPNNF